MKITNYNHAGVAAVLFDLDGTIIDTNELIIQSFLYALQGIVPDGFGREQIIPYMGEPLPSQLQRFSGLEDVVALVGKYREGYAGRQGEMLGLFPGVAEVIRQLHRSGIRLGVVTTKMRDTAIQTLELMGLLEAMDCIVSLSDVTHAKPHPEPVQLAISQLQADPLRTLMVGDSSVDIQSAAAAGVTPVGVAWSLKGESVLRQAGAAHIIHEMADLLALCDVEGVSV